MVNTSMTFVFKHPKYYTELRKRNKSDQAISLIKPDGENESVRPGPGLKQQASSAKLVKHQAASIKPQATSVKLKATSVKPQATSVKLEATSFKLLDS